MRSSRPTCCCSLLIFVIALGCGGGPQDVPELGTVSGTVTLDGKPVANANVRFQPVDGRASEALTDEQGNYSLRYTADSLGAKVGEHHVYVSTASEGYASESTGEDEGKWVEGQEETIPKRYQEEGSLVKKVEPGNNTINLELTTE